MKQLIFALSICLTFGVTAAFADGGADLYAKRCSKCHGADGSKASGASGGTMLKGLSVDAAKGKLGDAWSCGVLGSVGSSCSI